VLFNPIGIWFRGLLSLAAIGIGIYLLTRWHDALPTEQPVAQPTEQPVDPPTAMAPASRPLTSFGERLSAWRPGWDWPTAFLAGGAGLLLWSGLGRFVTPKLWLRREDDEPKQERGGEERQIRRPDGTVLHVELYGDPDAPPVVFTHGWGGDATEWYYIKKDLARRFRLILWDLPGLGRSTGPDTRDFTVDKMARDLDAVLELAGGRPAVLVGHSIGGMISLTHCKLFPEAMGTRVAGLLLVHTTYTNPVYTKEPTWLLPVIQKPVLEPICWLTVGLSPVARLMTLLSYANGSAHWSNHRSLFAGTESKGQLEFVTEYMIKQSPAVLARGTLGMFRYDATAVLPAVTVPTLVVAGDRDRTTVPEASRRIAEGVPGAELVTLAPARHMGLLEHHAEFTRLVTRFVETAGKVPA
jgi:pimeloyl-ACP methyl ester carboxylesterase